MWLFPPLNYSDHVFLLDLNKKEGIFKLNYWNTQSKRFFSKFTGSATQIRVRILHRINSKIIISKWKFRLENPLRKIVPFSNVKTIFERDFSVSRHGYADRVDICNSTFMSRAFNNDSVKLKPLVLFQNQKNLMPSAFFALVLPIPTRGRVFFLAGLIGRSSQRNERTRPRGWRSPSDLSQQ